MKELAAEQLATLAGPYDSPEGYYRYIKSIPFLGTLKSSVDSLTAGQWTEIVIEYTVGGSGLADGAWIKGTFKFYSVSNARAIGCDRPADFSIRIGHSSKRRIPKTTIMCQRNTFPETCSRVKHRQRCRN